MSFVESNQHSSTANPNSQISKLDPIYFAADFAAGAFAFFTGCKALSNCAPAAFSDAVPETNSSTCRGRMKRSDEKWDAAGSEDLPGVRLFGDMMGHM